MNRLDEILQVKRAEIEELRSARSNLERRASVRSDFRNFRSALSRPDNQLAIIAEVKKASPSAGVIATSFNPVDIGRKYEQEHADAISVLTERHFFQGAPKDLFLVRRAVSLPVLRKDFILDQVQILASAAIGADAILLIVAALKQRQLIDLLQSAAKYRLDALVEVHTDEELHRALDAGANIIGINNRNLATFEVDLGTTEKLCREVPDEVVLVGESGIKTPKDVARLKGCGVDAVLVGEALMRGEISVEQIRGAGD